MSGCMQSWPTHLTLPCNKRGRLTEKWLSETLIQRLPPWRDLLFLRNSTQKMSNTYQTVKIHRPHQPGVDPFSLCQILYHSFQVQPTTWSGPFNNSSIHVKFLKP